MKVVLDTVSLNQLLLDHSRAALTSLVEPSLKSGALAFVVDRDQALIHEWCRTCGWELVQVLVARWEPMGGFIVPEDVPALERTVARRLRRLGFTGTIDKLVLRLAVATPESRIVSEDGDFWDPDSARRGDPAGRIATLLRDQLNVVVMLLAGLLHELGQVSS